MLNTGISLQRLATKAGVGFTPKKLFSNGEAGVWYDPSDVEASLTWRRNLLEYTESFNLSPWQKINMGGTAISVIPSTHQAPDGSYSGVQILGLDTNQDRVDQATGIPSVANKTYTYSVWLRGSGVININVGSSTGVGGSTEATVNLTSTWTRYSVTNTFNSAPSGNVRVHGVITRVTGTAPEVHAFGAQLEEGSTATEYQPIRTTFDNAFKQAFPKHTLYQNHLGRTPVTGLGQAVGLMLDKSQGLQLGDELVDTANTASAWTPYSSNTVAQDGNAIKISYVDHVSGAYIYFTEPQGTSETLTVGKTYEVTLKAKVNSGSEVIVEIQNGSVSSFIPVTSTDYVDIKYTITVVNNSFVRTVGMTVGEIVWVKDVSVKEVKGSHATQSDSTKRPVFARHPERGRVNLFKYTEEFDNGFYDKGPSTVLTTNHGVAPNGTQTADRVEFATTGGTYFSVDKTLESGKTYTFSVYVKATSSNSNFDFYYNDGSGTNQQVGQQTATSEWQRFEYTITTVGVNTRFGVNNAGDTYASDILIWGAQLEEANEATGYQKVVDDYDITESGYKSVYYLQFDGVNDGMQINNLTSSSTPLTALFGYSSTGQSDTDYIFDVVTGRTIFGLRNGFVRYLDGAWSEFAADTNSIKVLTYDMVEDNAKIRINGNQEYTDTSYDQKAISGDIGLYQAFSQTGAYLAGNLYQYVVRAAESTDKEIDQAEEFVAIKTGLKSEVVGLATLDLNFGANTYTARNSNGSVL